MIMVAEVCKQYSMYMPTAEHTKIYPDIITIPLNNSSWEMYKNPVMAGDDFVKMCSVCLNVRKLAPGKCANQV